MGDFGATTTTDDALPSWMIDEDPDYVRPAPPAGKAPRGWWDLLIVEGMWKADAAQILDIPVGTVMSRLHRGRRILKTALAEQAAPA